MLFVHQQMLCFACSKGCILGMLLLLHTRRASFPACADRRSAVDARRAAFPTCTVSSNTTDPPAPPTHPHPLPPHAMHQGTLQRRPMQKEQQHHATDGPCAPPQPQQPPISAGPHSHPSSCSGPCMQLCTRLPFMLSARRQEVEHGEEAAAPDHTSRGVSADGALGTLGDRGAVQTDALGCRMEEVVVKQGVLHLQLQQTFGKVRVQHGGLPARALGGLQGGCMR